MSAVWAAEGFVAGVPAGTVLRSAVFQLSVPSDAPDQTTCPRCAAAVPRWLVVRCGHCGHHFGTLGALELATATVLGCPQCPHRITSQRGTAAAQRGQVVWSGASLGTDSWKTALRSTVPAGTPATRPSAAHTALMPD